MLDSEVDSAKSFVRLWICLLFLVLAYAWLDLRLHPALARETQFSLEPNLAQVDDLLHWGGRLLNHRQLPLLVGNALVLSGLAALILRGALALGRRWLRPSAEPRISIVPGGVPSVRPEDVR